MRKAFIRPPALLNKSEDLGSKNTNSVIKMTFFVHGGISMKIFVIYVDIINKTFSHKFHPYSILSTYLNEA